MGRGDLGWGERIREQRTKAAASTTASSVEERWWIAGGMTPVCGLVGEWGKGKGKGR